MRSNPLAAVLTVFFCGAALAADVGVVSHVKVVSDKVPDVSSLEAWKQSFIRAGMTDQEKALAVWKSAVMFRHQDVPPREFLANELDVHDPIKSFNVYGYGQCCCASAHVEALSRHIGLESRGWGITGHSVPEVNVGGRWCMLDSSLINYFRKPDGSIAGVEEISHGITQFYDQHPELRNNDAALTKFMRNGGWKAGPAVVAGGTGYDANGWLPAATHGWFNSMQEFGSESKNFQYEYGSALGYEVNIQLRPGEKLVRNWSNRGLHVNMIDGAAPGVLKTAVGTNDLRYSPALGDLAPGRIGNGTLEYDPLAAGGKFGTGMLVCENLASRDEDHAGPAVHVKDSASPGVFIVRMPSSYVYLGGELSLTPVVSGGSVEVSFSDNNGLDWKPIGSFTSPGPRKIDLKPLVFRRYDYRLKFTLNGKGTGLDAVRIAHDIQHSQRTLPALDKGENHIHFAAGAQEGTITVEGSTNPGAAGKNLLFSDFHPQLDGIGTPNLVLQGGAGTIVVPLQTPGEITRLRIGCHYRARDAKDGWTVEASFDGGMTYRPVGKLEGPHAGYSKYLVLDHVPPASRSALVRFSGTQRNTTLIFDLRVSADYREPHGGFAPVKVTYAWQEDGRTKQDVHVARRADESYVIRCDDKPVMKSIALERAE